MITAMSGTSEDIDGISTEEHIALIEERRILINQAAHLARLWRKQRSRIDELEGIRKNVPVRVASLIPARVDRTAGRWRDTMIADKGSRDGVKVGQVVATRKLDRGEADGVEKGMAVIAKNYFVGRVVSVGPYSCQFQLLSDRSVRGVPVAIEGVDRTEEGEKSRSVSALLEGEGNWKTVCRHVDVRGGVKPGDAVLARSDGGYLPVPMLIGYVKDIVPLAEKPLVATVSVKPDVELRLLDTVYILDPTRRAP
jgi:cell shape-determining protein MreC